MHCLLQRSVLLWHQQNMEWECAVLGILWSWVANQAGHISTWTSWTISQSVKLGKTWISFRSNTRLFVVSLRADEEAQAEEERAVAWWFSRVLILEILEVVDEWPFIYYIILYIAYFDWFMCLVTRQVLENELPSLSMLALTSAATLPSREKNLWVIGSHWELSIEMRLVTVISTALNGFLPWEGPSAPEELQLLFKGDASDIQEFLHNAAERLVREAFYGTGSFRKGWASVVWPQLGIWEFRGKTCNHSSQRCFDNRHHGPYHLRIWWRIPCIFVWHATTIINSMMVIRIPIQDTRTHDWQDLTVRAVTIWHTYEETEKVRGVFLFWRTSQWTR